MITAVVLAKNESHNLPRCLSSLKFCSRILVLDDNSHDSTPQVAQKFAAEVIKRPLNGDFSSQRNFALQLVKTPWALFVDADEEVTSQLAAEIIASVPGRHPAFQVNRVDYIWDTRLNFGDTGRFYVTRLVKVGTGTWEGRVHEVWKTGHTAVRLKHPLRHYPHPDMASFLKKINLYSSIRSAELHSAGVKASLWQIIAFPPGKFFYLYLLKLGFLDGTAGFVHAMTMAFYSFLVRGKLFLLARGIS